MLCFAETNYQTVTAFLIEIVSMYFVFVGTTLAKTFITFFFMYIGINLPRRTRASNILSSTSDQYVAVFYVTDILVEFKQFRP